MYYEDIRINHERYKDTMGSTQTAKRNGECGS